MFAEYSREKGKVPISILSSVSERTGRTSTGAGGKPRGNPWVREGVRIGSLRE